MNTTPSTAILLLASGRGTRFGSETPKVYLPCAGRPLLLRSLDRLAAAVPAANRQIILAANPDDRVPHVQPLEARLRAGGVDEIVDGGATRQQSMQRALAAVSGTPDLVLIHDAARPFPPVAAIRAAVDAAHTEGAALLAVPVVDTLKRAVRDGSGRYSRVARTESRTDLWAAQTPQVLRFEWLKDALAAAARDGFDGTDDISLLEQPSLGLKSPESQGRTAVLIPSESTNLKVTTPADLRLAEWIATQQDPEHDAQ